MALDFRFSLRRWWRLQMAGISSAATAGREGVSYDSAISILHENRLSSPSLFLLYEPSSFSSLSPGGVPFP